MVLLHGFMKKTQKTPKQKIDLAIKRKKDRNVKKKNIGSTFDSWLREEGLYEKVSATAIKRVVARQVEAAMRQTGSEQCRHGVPDAYQRAALDRLLDPENGAVTLRHHPKSRRCCRASSSTRAGVTGYATIQRWSADAN
jgi:antitoxin HicB